MSIEIQGPDAARAEESALALNRGILDSLTTLVKRAGTIGQSIAAGSGSRPMTCSRCSSWTTRSR